MDKEPTPHFTPREFPEMNSEIAKHQDQYGTLPAFTNPHQPATPMTFCWRPSLWARIKLLFTGKLWHTVYTCGNPLQPIFLSLDKDNHIPKGVVVGDVDGCSACGKDHKRLTFYALDIEYEDYTHVADCPNSTEPVFMREVSPPETFFPFG
jgi:hypothetical protein